MLIIVDMNFGRSTFDEFVDMTKNAPIVKTYLDVYLEKVVHRCLQEERGN